MALDALGVEDGPPEYYQPDVDRSMELTERARMLRRTLEAFILQMAAESAEINCAETTDTLRMQAIGVLVALRELQRHIPEVADETAVTRKLSEEDR